MFAPYSSSGAPGDVERPEDGRLRRAGRAWVLERVDQHRDPERVGPEDELLAVLVGDLARGRERGDRGAPLVLAQPDLGHEGVQMADERLHDLAQAGVVAAREARLDGGGDVGGRRPVGGGVRGSHAPILPQAAPRVRRDRTADPQRPNGGSEPRPQRAWSLLRRVAERT